MATRVFADGPGSSREKAQNTQKEMLFLRRLSCFAAVPALNIAVYALTM
jgi:hypothetical protein